MHTPSLKRGLALLGTLAYGLVLHGADLKIHVINVGWGSSILLEGPTGKRALLEAGHGQRAAKVVDYLTNVAHVPAGGIDVVVLGHNHADHGAGLPDVWAAGLVSATPKCWYNGSTNNASLVSTWFAAYGKMPDAAVPATTPLIDLGGGAQVWCIAAKGRNLAPGSTASQSSDENDNSMGLVVKYGGFTYLWTSDMGGFGDDDGCSGRSSAQADIEVPMINAAIAAGVLTQGGVDVLEIGHHGSESSTHPDYVKAAHPSLCLISTGRGQSSSWDLPRKAVVDNVLLGACGFSPAPLVLQTEDGDRNDQGKRSTSGYAVGNIVVDTDGTKFWVSANGDASTINIADSSSVAGERANAGLTGTADSRGRAFAVHGGGTLPAPSFSLSLGSGSLALVQGGSASTQVSLTAQNGFTGSAALSLSGSVPGVTATFSPATVTVPGTATLTLAAASTATVGSTAVSVKGLSGSTGATAPLSVQVQQAATPSFTVALNPAALTLAPGASTTVQVSLAAQNGFTGTATLSATSIPGVTAAFSPASVAVPGTATLTLTAASTAAPGTTAATVTGTSGTKTANAGLSVQVQPTSGGVFSETETNDTLATANVVPATATGITGFFPSTSDNDDWFQVTLPAGRTLALSMTGPTASQQDYDLYLTSSTGSVLASSENQGTTESLSYKNTGTTTKTVYVHVSRYASYSRVTPYTISMSR